MFKFNRLVCALAVCTCVAIAYGAATKIRSFENVAESNPDADGMAILNYASGQDETIVQIILSDFTHDTAYDMVFVSPTHSLQPKFLGTLITDKHGHGNLHVTISAPPGENGDWTDAHIEIWINLGTIDPDELRAVGCNPNNTNPCP